MSNQLQIFDNPDFGKIRAIEINNEPWIVGKDAAIALGYQNPAEALTDHVPAKFKKIITRKQWQQMASNQETSKTLFSESTMGGVQRVTLINEAGLYKLVMRSKLPNAEKFSDWVCSEVLPSVRKTGFYATPAKIDEIVRNPDLFIEELISAYKRTKDERDEARAEVAELKPDAQYCREVLSSDSTMLPTTVAKALNTTVIKFHRWLQDTGLAYFRNKVCHLKAKYAGIGYEHYAPVKGTDGKFHEQMYWTQKGFKWIRELWLASNSGNVQQTLF